jgi:hypothetical protein
MPVYITSILKVGLKNNPEPIHDVAIVLASSRQEAIELVVNYKWPEEIWQAKSKTLVRTVFELDALAPETKYRLISKNSVSVDGMKKSLEAISCQLSSVEKNTHKSSSIGGRTRLKKKVVLQRVRMKK